MRDHNLRDRTESPSVVLTEREQQITQMVREGLSNKEIGRRCNVSDGTVKVHLHHIYEKLAIHNRTALAVLDLGTSRDMAEKPWSSQLTYLLYL
jgi:two-component system, NarL family, nitrate/nitrite response regulator NarL